MSYINVGAYVNGKRPASKKALKDALVSAPESVTFDSTGMMGPVFNGGPMDIPIGATLSVVGPDPYTSRKFYASVTLRLGKITLK